MFKRFVQIASQAVSSYENRLIDDELFAATKKRGRKESQSGVTYLLLQYVSLCV